MGPCLPGQARLDRPSDGLTWIFAPGADAQLTSPQGWDACAGMRVTGPCQIVLHVCLTRTMAGTTCYTFVSLPTIWNVPACKKIRKSWKWNPVNGGENAVVSCSMAVLYKLNHVDFFPAHNSVTFDPIRLFRWRLRAKMHRSRARSAYNH